MTFYHRSSVNIGGFVLSCQDVKAPCHILVPSIPFNSDSTDKRNKTCEYTSQNDTFSKTPGKELIEGDEHD